jgi:KDO2-lipid IV(A) lauroyltransferase
LVYLLGIRRRVALEGLARAFPERSSSERQRLARACYSHLGRGLIEILLVRRMTNGMVDELVSFEGYERYQAANALGKGVVVAMAHFGNWELLGRACASRGMRFGVIVRTLRGRFNRALTSWREEIGMGLLRDRASTTDALRRLRSGETLAVVIDQNMRPSRGIFVSFFGALACTTPAAAVFSLRSGAPLLAVFPVRLPDGTHRIQWEGPFLAPQGFRGHQAVVALTQELTHAVERAVRAHPEQWYWLHRRWKTRPQEAPA